MRREDLYLADIIDAAAAIHRFTENVSREQFLKDELRQSAVLQKLTVIGEAAARLPLEFREEHAEVEWADIVAFRNIAVHAYFSIDWRVVWTAAIQDVPALQLIVGRIVENSARRRDSGESSSK